MGSKPVPHVPARFVRDRDDLARRLEAFAREGKVERVLVLGGGAKHPVGDYRAAIELLETGLLQANGSPASAWPGIRKAIPILPRSSASVH